MSHNMKVGAVQNYAVVCFLFEGNNRMVLEPKKTYSKSFDHGSENIAVIGGN